MPSSRIKPIKDKTPWRARVHTPKRHHRIFSQQVIHRASTAGQRSFSSMQYHTVSIYIRHVTLGWCAVDIIVVVKLACRLAMEP